MSDFHSDALMTRRDFLAYALKASATLGLLGGTSGLVSACATPTAAPTAAPVATAKPTPEEVLMQLNWLFNVQFGGFWAAQEKGFFTAENIIPKFQPGGPNVQPETIVGAGTAPIGLSGASANLIKAINAGAKIKAIGAIYQTSPNGLVSLAKKPIRSLQDAVGKKIGLQPGARSTWSALLKRANIAADKMEIVQVGVDPAPLVAGQVDAFWCFVINQPLTLTQQGVENVVVSQGELGVPGGGNFIVASQDAIDKRKDALVRYMRALRKGWEYNMANTDEIAKLTVEKIAPDQKLDLKVQQDQNKAQSPYLQSNLTKSKGLLYMDEAGWEEVMKFLVDAGEIEKPVPVTQVMTTDILKAAFG